MYFIIYRSLLQRIANNISLHPIAVSNRHRIIYFKLTKTNTAIFAEVAFNHLLHEQVVIFFFYAHDKLVSSCDRLKSKETRRFGSNL